MKKNAWLLRPLPHGSNHMQDFLDQNIIAVGYPVGKDLSKYNYEDTRGFLEDHKWEEGIGNVNTLVKVMEIDDIVIVPDDNKKDVYFGTIISDYTYEPSLDENKPGSGYPHQRSVEWFFNKKPLLRSNLPEEIKSSMRYPGAVSNLTKHYTIIMNIINRGHIQKPSSLETKALNVIEGFLDSDNPELRLRAAEVIIKNKRILG